MELANNILSTSLVGMMAAILIISYDMKDNYPDWFKAVVITVGGSSFVAAIFSALYVIWA